jgi:phospholipid/cholesterol/gamma-HCH transport system substrate-binding protein
LAAAPYLVLFISPDAWGRDGLDAPAAAVAGTPVGNLTKVEYENGRALVTLTFSDDMRGKIFADATAAIRPASALQNLLVNIDPGTPNAGELTEPIPPWRTTSYVAIDELTGILDADTQAYTTILIQQLELALHHREGELQHALARVGDLVDAATPLSRALAERRRLLTRLVGDLDVVANTLGDRGAQLASAVNAGSATLAVTSARERELAEATRLLGPVLSEANRSLEGLAAIAGPLIPALDDLTPAAAPLAASVQRLRDLIPQADGLVDRFEELVAKGAEPLRLLEQGTRGIGDRAADLLPDARAGTTLARRLNHYKKGIRQTADNISGAFSAQDTGGGYGQVDFIRVEPLRPENFGLPAGTNRAQLAHAVALALERTCITENPLACAVRFAIPGLPKQPLLGGDG